MAQVWKLRSVFLLLIFVLLMLLMSHLYLSPISSANNGSPYVLPRTNNRQQGERTVYNPANVVQDRSVYELTESVNQMYDLFTSKLLSVDATRSRAGKIFNITNSFHR